MRNPVRYQWKAFVAHLPLSTWDYWNNLRRVRGSPRILITRHSGKRAYVFRDFLAWVRETIPELSSRMEFRRLPCPIQNWTPYSLHVSWAGDLVDLWSPRSYQQALHLQAEAEGNGLTIINRLERLMHTSKSRGAELMRSFGVRTPRHVLISDPVAFRRNHGGLDFPLILREDRGHGQASILIERPTDLAKVDFSQFRSPVAVEFIETRSSQDGLYRKYRFVAAGELGAARHLIANRGWEVRPDNRVTDSKLREEEVEYLSLPDPNHELLQAARRCLGLDIVGFDYSYDQRNKLVIWEANPFLNLNYPSNSHASHIGPAVRRSFAIVASHYCHCAGIPLPAPLESLLDSTVSGVNSALAA